MGDVSEPAPGAGSPIFIVTGFSSFSGVAANPTESLIHYLESSEAESAGDFGVAACMVLDVDARALPKRLSELRARLPAGDSRQVVWLHLGVDARGSHLKLEGAAYNCADFRCKDTSAWQPSKVRIDDSLPLDARLQTDLPVDQLAATLTAGAEGDFDVRVSDDPGRFVCNYIYFLSQRQCAVHPGWHALFVHVPAFSVVAEALQRDFLVRLLRGIAALPQLRTPAAADSEAVDSVAQPAPTGVSKQQAGKPAKEVAGAGGSRGARVDGFCGGRHVFGI